MNRTQLESETLSMIYRVYTDRGIISGTFGQLQNAYNYAKTLGHGTKIKYGIVTLWEIGKDIESEGHLDVIHERLFWAYNYMQQAA